MEFIPSEKQIVIHSNSLKHNPQNISQLVFERNDFIKRWIATRTIVTFPIGYKISLEYSRYENSIYGNTIHMREFLLLNISNIRK